MAISDAEIKAITNAIDLKVRDRLDQHREEMKKSSREAREVTVESLTGYKWDDRYVVRNTIQWAVKKHKKENRNLITFWGAAIVLGTTAFWDHIKGIWQ